jgi:hypothetical protein
MAGRVDRNGEARQPSSRRKKPAVDDRRQLELLNSFRYHAFRQLAQERAFTSSVASIVMNTNTFERPDWRTCLRWAVRPFGWLRSSTGATLRKE